MAIKKLLLLLFSINFSSKCPFTRIHINAAILIIFTKFLKNISEFHQSLIQFKTYLVNLKALSEYQKISLTNLLFLNPVNYAGFFG